MLKIVQCPPTSHRLQPKAPRWPVEPVPPVMVPFTSATSHHPHHPASASPGFCASKCGVLPSASFYCPFFPGTLISDSTRPTSPLFTGRDPVQTSAHLGVSIPPSGLPWDSGPASHPVSWMECSLSLRTGSQLAPLDFLQNPQMLENRWREAIVRQLQAGLSMQH